MKQLQNRTFKCPISNCKNKEHTKPIDGFGTNQLVIQLLSVKPIKVYRGEKIENLNTNLDKIKKLVQEIEIKFNESDAEIHEYCKELIDQIQLEKEEKIKQIEDLSQILID